MSAVTDYTKTTTENNLQWAITYQKLGWAVIPMHTAKGHSCTCKDGASCTNQGKHPRVNWEEFQEKPPTELQLRQWWRKWPNANIGIVTGKVSGIIVLDVDGPQGDATLREGNYHIPPTVTAKSGGDGWHYFYKHPGGDCRNFAGQRGGTILPKVDFRGDGGCIVASPSLHKSGNFYEWLISPEDAELADPPEWLVKLIRAQDNARSNHLPGNFMPIDWSKDVTEGQRNNELTRRAGSLLAKMAPAEALTMLLAWNQEHCCPPLEEQEVKKIVESISKAEARKAASANDYDENDQAQPPAIDAGNEDLAHVTSKAWAAIERLNRFKETIFRRGGEAVRIELDETKSPVIVPLGQDRMRHELARCARWYKQRTNRLTNEKVKVPAKPPIDVVKDVLATPNYPLPILQKVTRVPVFGPDGHLIQTPGYHESAQVYYKPDPAFTIPHVSERPTKEDVETALSLLTDELLVDFPFESEADRTTAISLFLLPFVRDMIDGPTPFHLIDAPTPGSGKGLLAQALLLPTMGPIEPCAQAENEEEWRKRLTSVFRDGSPLFWLDNLTCRLDSGSLASAITATRWTDRVLGETRTLSLPVTCVFGATANNPTVSAEIARRTVRIRLIPLNERPWERNPDNFRHPQLLSWAKDNRGSLIWAGLTIVRGWIAAGKPAVNGQTLGSFESWSKLMGNILAFAELPGFLTNLDDIYDQAAEEVGRWRTFILAWWDKYEHHPVSARELLPIAIEADIDVGDGPPNGQTRSLGAQLAKHKDAIFSDLQVNHYGSYNNRKLWSLVRVKTGKVY